METTVENPFLQLLGLGSLWVFFHCSAMCGPLIAGLQIGRSILYYQAGRLLMYGIFGALAGYVGHSFSLASLHFGWLSVGVIALLTLHDFFPLSGSTTALPRPLLRLWQILQARPQNSARAFISGLALSFLPCMLVFWSLQLAASTRSPLQGALLMQVLVALTTLPLAAVALGTQVRCLRIQSKWWVRILLLTSLTWSVLVVLAAEGILDHQHLMFELFGKKYVLMFW